MPDSMIHFGGAVKTLDETGRIGGYAVTFTDEKRKDLDGEFFDSKSYLGARKGDGCDTLFHHGFALKKGLEKFADHIFAPVKTVADDIGLFAETVLDLSDAYEKKVYELAKKNKLKWSTGAASHTVQREANGYLKRWIIAEISLTPTPAEPQNNVLPIESLRDVKFAKLDDIEDADESAAIIPIAPNTLAAKLSQHIDDLADDKGRTKEAIVAQMAREAGLDVKAVEGVLDGSATPSNAKLKAFARVLDVSFDALKAFARSDHLQTIKGMFEEALAEQTPSRWELESIYCRIIKKLAAAAAASQMAGVTFDLSAKVAEATTEYTNLLQTHALAQIQTWIESGGEDDFYLKAIIDCEASAKALASSDLDTHSQLTVSVLREIAKRFRGNHEGRVKAGRVLSEKNRMRIGELRKLIAAVDADLESLLNESTPMASEAEKSAALSTHLRQRWRARQLGVTANV